MLKEISSRIGIERYFSRYLKWERKGKDEWAAKCPFHDDGATPSLSVNIGSGVWYCHGCKASGNMVGFHARITNKTYQEALKELSKEANMHTEEVRENLKQREVAATYNYTSESGELLFQVLRLTPKSFLQRKPISKGKWSYSLKHVKKVLYRLPEVHKAVSEGRPVFITEGEKDADTIMKWGFTATTNSGGAKSKWLPQYSEPLKDAEVIISPDADLPGQEHANKVAAALRGIAKSVRILILPNGDKDITEAVEHGLSKEAFEGLVSTAQEWKPGDESTDLEAFPFTELGNAERIQAEHGERMCYCWERSTWFIWSGKRWKQDHQATGRDFGPLAVKLASKTARRFLNKALSLDIEDSRRKKLVTWGTSFERANGLAAALVLARTFPTMIKAIEELDADPFLFNCKNGTIDLKTGELRPHNREDYLTKLSKVEYDKDAKSEIWDQFLKTCTNGNEELEAFLPRVVGYSMTGSTVENKLFLLLGPGATGKSTFIAAVKHILGDYGATTDFETFLEQKNFSGPRPELAKLVGKRAVFSLEVKHGKRLAEDVIKAITGGDAISVRSLYANPFEFVPAFKLLLAANDSPKARTEDSAMWRRILRLPFERVIPEAEQDKRLGEKLTSPEVARAILAWGVRGCLAWQQGGLQVPTTVKDATEELRRELSPMSEFFDNNCIFGARLTTLTSYFRSKYEEFCASNNYKPISSRLMYSILQSLGCSVSKSHGSRYFNGIGILDKIHSDDQYIDQQVTLDLTSSENKNGNGNGDVIVI